MGYTIEEFSTVLNGGFSGPGSGLSCTVIDGATWQIKMSAASNLRLTIQPAPLRRLGSLEIPVLHVVFEFSGFSSQQKKALLDRFNRYFHKGGG